MNRNIEPEAWLVGSGLLLVVLMAAFLLWGEARQQGYVEGIKQGRHEAARGYLLKSAAGGDPLDVPPEDQFYVDRWDAALDHAMDELNAEGYWRSAGGD